MVQKSRRACYSPNSFVHDIICIGTILHWVQQSYNTRQPTKFGNIHLKLCRKRCKNLFSQWCMTYDYPAGAKPGRIQQSNNTDPHAKFVDDQSRTLSKPGGGAVYSFLAIKFNIAFNDCGSTGTAVYMIQQDSIGVNTNPQTKFGDDLSRTSVRKGLEIRPEKWTTQSTFDQK